MGLDGKVCIITGGGSGIGRSTALMMAGAGAKVVLVGRTASKVEQVQKEIESAGGTATASSLDVADREAGLQLAKDVLAEFGRVDVLLNNAGHSSKHRMLMTTTPEELRSVIDTNLI
ncbi:MAG: SDR family NAD(P)-dependent oxidoreductase, partial [Chloroflexi bacterium]|nr:SDR family NAD(P)-dependent oxidoreductase [Chloroflexota bacterium]